MTRNGFDGAWNPICPSCGGYMHTGHEPDCPVTLALSARIERIVALLHKPAAASVGGPEETT